MKIIVISLLKSHDRREKVVKNLGQLGIEFEFLDAVDGRIDDHPYLKNYNEKAFLVNRRRPAVLGELGCYASHLLAWEKCVALNEPLVVLEDDFELTADFVAGLQFVEPFMSKVSFIRLERLESTLTVMSYKTPIFSLVKMLKPSLCTTGYVVSPQGAAAFLKNGREMCFPVDLYLKHTAIHKQLMHALTPNIVYATHADTIIGHAGRDFREKGFALMAKRFFRKWLYSISNKFFIVINIFTKF